MPSSIPLSEVLRAADQQNLIRARDRTQDDRQQTPGPKRHAANRTAVAQLGMGAMNPKPPPFATGGSHRTTQLSLGPSALGKPKPTSVQSLRTSYQAVSYTHLTLPTKQAV